MNKMGWNEFVRELADNPEKLRGYIVLGAAAIFGLLVFIWGLKQIIFG